MKNHIRILILLLVLFMALSLFACTPTERQEDTLFTISFDSNGGDNVELISAKSGDKITAPKAPAKVSANKWEKYEFCGWYTDNATFNNQFVFDTMPNFNNILYAKWSLVDVWEAIDSQDGLKNVEEWGNYYLTKNITLTKDWEAIDSFLGKFDGKNFKISALTIKLSQNVNVGAFIISNRGTVSNLTLEGVDIKVSSDTQGAAAGGITVYNQGGVIDNCKVNGKITANGQSMVWVGGIAAENKGTILRSHTAVIIEANSTVFGTHVSNVGGVVGYMTAAVEGSDSAELVASVENCSAAGDITVGTQYLINVGGLIGTSYGKVLSSCATGNIAVITTDEARVGGLIGMNEINATVKNCYATGNVQVNAKRAFAGGFVGQSDAVINYGYATGDVTSVSSEQESFAGGFAGKGRENTTFIGCLAMGNVTASTVSGSVLTGGFIASFNNAILNSCYRYESQTVAPSPLTNEGTECNDENLNSQTFYKNSLKFAEYTEGYQPSEGEDWLSVWVLPLVDGDLPILYWQN